MWCYLFGYINITVPPITERVSFNVRKKEKTVFTLDDYIQSGKNPLKD